MSAYTKNSPRLAFCPIGKFAFSHEDALRHKQELCIFFKEEAIDFIPLEGVISDGIIRSDDHVEPAVKYFTEAGVDALFIPHCNFGTESAAAKIARDLAKPTLLWAPRDGAPLADGSRLRDSLCGAFATSRVLQNLGVEFSYIPNVSISDEAFRLSFHRFLRAADVVRHVNGAVIGMIGNRIDFFWSTMTDELDLMSRFGIEVHPFNLSSFIQSIKDQIKKNYSAYLDEAQTIATSFEDTGYPEEHLIANLAFRDVIIQLATKHHLSAVTVESFMTIVETFDTFFALGMALVSDSGIPCICESDVLGAVSSIMLEAAAGRKEPSFFADVTIRHPENDNGVLLWHDSFPLSLKKPGVKAKIDKYFILTDAYSGMLHFPLRNGEITIMRFGGRAGDYKIFAEEVKTIDGPVTQNTYVWVECKDFSRLEDTLIHGPFIHHTSCIYGHHRDVLIEAVRYLPSVSFYR